MGRRASPFDLKGTWIRCDRCGVKIDPLSRSNFSLGMTAEVCPRCGEKAQREQAAKIKNFTEAAKVKGLVVTARMNALGEAELIAEPKPRPEILMPVSELLADPREIEMIVFNNSPHGQRFEIGSSDHHVDKIEIYTEPGPYCDQPWVKVEKAGQVVARVPAFAVSIHYAAPSQQVTDAAEVPDESR